VCVQSPVLDSQTCLAHSEDADGVGKFVFFWGPENQGEHV